jgi:hypothetical protein
MRALIVGLGLAAGLASAAQAQSVGGSYIVHGTNPNGSAYSGTAEISPRGDACRITWQTGSSSSQGICMLADKAFASYYHLGDDVGLVVYQVQPDGSLKGYWTIKDQKGVGTETLTPK